MDKKRVIELLDQLSPILAGKEEEIGKEKTGKLQSALLVTKEDVAVRTVWLWQPVCQALFKRYPLPACQEPISVLQPKKFPSGKN
ncbi:hypothetical protein [Streptococcus suis]|uniref:Uncharacterized protein n=1 Tax=Streptococcus suis R61 TaxID=996306 RepID=A0AA87FAB9_STRSU|nr:hypothetical protein [Streptococcus suis]ATZ04025.1 hypothetical protein CVO91_09020 [Streptococcus suis]EHC03529.1 hypothetical protein SSUR61_0525 [Streptococcus suis R61]MBY5000253.1 hypothetical protein [Streptococcus suis]MBY5011294.1 hypothetical protein [Streptococcus suis]MBY5018177.1 hypothetical protein [Streptococcus suis]